MPLARWFRRWLMWLCGISRKVFARNCNQEIGGFCLNEKSILVVLMAILVTLVAAETVMEITVRMKRPHINIIQLHLMLLLGVT
jgi:hypothetical protein